jgi:iron complex outermembrane recepter protein
MHRLCRISLTGLLAAVSLTTQLAYAQTIYQFDLPAQPLADSLRAVGRLTHTNVLFDPPLVDGLGAPPLKANLTASQAYARLLVGTALQSKFLDDTTVEIARIAEATAPTDPPAGIDPSAASPGPDPKEGKTNSRREFRPAQVDQGAPAPASTAGSSNSGSYANSGEVKLEEIVVTAQKRAERLIDVPQSVTVLTSQDLSRMGAVQFRDFANTVPGVSFTTEGAGITQIIMRGVTTGVDQGPTVAIYVDDVPYGTSTPFGGGATASLDVGLFDLDRIEVLRGPQGTLYGASAMGGLLKYVTKRPDTSTFAGDVFAGLAGTRDGGISYNGASEVNFPIVVDRAAVRASAYYFRDGGYIDNLTLRDDDVNRAGIYGGRLDTLLTPSDALSIRITGFLQNIARDGTSLAGFSVTGTPLDEGLDQRYQIPEFFNQRFRLVSGTVEYDFGPAQLTSISSYQSMSLDSQYDISSIDVPLLGLLFDRTYSAVGVYGVSSTKRFSQELRLASHGRGRVEWLAGAFYTHESTTDYQIDNPYDLGGHLSPNDLFTYYAPTLYKQIAGFADLTLRCNDKLDISGGLRYSQNRQSHGQTGSGLLIGSSPTIEITDDVTTYLADARYHPTHQSTVYLRYATGFRPGGPNFVAADPVTGMPLAPPTYKSDQLRSYELGIKAATAAHGLGVDLAAYQINWSDIQIQAIRNGLTVIANAGKAVIRGGELDLSVRPGEDLTVTAAFGYQDAHLAEASADLGGAEGERLPNVPKFTAALNSDYEIWRGGWQPIVGATIRFVSDRTSGFGPTGTSTNYHMPSYTSVDLRTGLTIGRVVAQLYAHNVLNERGQLSAQPVFALFGGPAHVSVMQPRTIGINLSTSF